MTFHQFKELPRELRTQIWEASIPKHQITEVWWTDEYLPREGLGIHISGQPSPPPRQKRVLFPKLPRQPISSLLHACHDSREIGLRYYQLTLPATDDEHRLKRNGKFSLHVSLIERTYSHTSGRPQQRIFGMDFHSVSTLYCNIESEIVFVHNFKWLYAFYSIGATYMTSLIHEPVLGNLKYLAVVHQVEKDEWVRSQDSTNHVTRMTHSGRDLRGLRGFKKLKELVIIVPKERKWDVERIRSVCQEEMEWAWDYDPPSPVPKVRIFEDPWEFKKLVATGKLMFGDRS